jgi:hypothetical protein
MFQNAFAMFFLAILTGCASALWTLLQTHAREIAAGLRGQDVGSANPLPWARLRPVRFRSGRRPAFQPVTFSICRL